MLTWWRRRRDRQRRERLIRELLPLAITAYMINTDSEFREQFRRELDRMGGHHD